MPLLRADDSYEPQGFGGILFPMADGTARIIYRVSYEALRDRATADGLGERFDAEETFHKHRPRIEQIASEKYDAGATERVVTTQELTPLSSHKVVSSSGLPLEQTTEIGRGLPPLRVSNADALSNMRDSMLVGPPDAVAPSPIETPRGIPPVIEQNIADSSGARDSANIDILPAAASLTIGSGTVESVLSEHPADIRDMARALSEEFTAQVEELQRRKPNDDRLAEYNALLAFFEKMARGLADLADALDRAVSTGTNGQLEPVFLGTAGEIARQLHLALFEWLEKDRTMIVEVPVRLALFGAGVAFLHSIGADGVAAITALTTLVLKRGSKPSKDGSAN
jgi:hypothetical protein